MKTLVIILAACLHLSLAYTVFNDPSYLRVEGGIYSKLTVAVEDEVSMLKSFFVVTTK
jgi:hypothetical protein